MSEHGSIYDHAELYARAFAYRDFERECAFLRAVYARHGAAPLETFLELGAGPADHSIALARLGIACTALDLSPAMAEYGLRVARAADVLLAYVVGDMRSFELARPVKLAACMLDTASYLLTNEDVREHLRCVANALEPGGVYLMELSHPRDLFGSGRSTTETWDVSTPEGTLTVEWVLVPGSFDPVTQTRDFAVTLTHRDHAGVERRHHDTSRQRAFTANELEALAVGAGLRVVDWFGALDVDVPFDASERAWRMVAVLQKP